MLFVFTKTDLLKSKRGRSRESLSASLVRREAGAISRQMILQALTSFDERLRSQFK